MSEALIQVNTTPLPGEEPFLGDLDDGELLVNTSDARIWSGTPDQTPLELGGAVKNKPIGPLLFSNFLDVDLSSPDQLPVANTNPLEVPPGFYRESRILVRFTETPPLNFQTYFDYPINWGNEDRWKIGPPSPAGDIDASNPVDYYRDQGAQILLELSSFGPSPQWLGRLLWVGTFS